MSVLLLPIKMLGFVAAGFALGVGWKLGSYLVNAVMANESLNDFSEDSGGRCNEGSEREGEPLWKRKF
ncbi:MAG: hypothetical protein HY912_04055 [Desulfomonile tiedjei]|uniref:Uncharacterized protein n=1 Tax=Desulfomonile tiedjei TaxID=2358 RepID=A0A9D6UYB1_9BACT|nr:hypothetical protein [Desulfomonile tiedjei]